MTRRVIVHKEMIDGMEMIDHLTMQRNSLVDQVKIVDKNLARLKNTAMPFATNIIYNKFDVQDLVSNRKNILKETDCIDKRILSEFASGAREMRWKLRCIAPPQDAVGGGDVGGVGAGGGDVGDVGGVGVGVGSGAGDGGIIHPVSM